MILEQFGEVLRKRLPTPAEFLAVIEGHGWKVVASEDGKACLRVQDGNDALALAFARMLSREPYRTNVLKEVFNKELQNQEPTPTGVIQVEAPPSLVPQPPKKTAREFRWRYGNNYVEDERDAKFGDLAHYPAGAWWWRWAGEVEWEAIPGRGGETHECGGMASSGDRLGEPQCDDSPAGQLPTA